MNRREIFILCILGLTALLTIGIRAISSGRGLVTNKARSLPILIGAWEGKDHSITPHEIELLRTKDYIYRGYRLAGRGDAVQLLVTWSSNDLEAVHPSDDCYTANGMEIIGWQAKTLEIPGYGPCPIVLKKVTGRSGDLYFFDLFRTSRGWNDDIWGHLFSLLAGSLAHRDPAGGKIRVETRIDKGGEALALSRLVDFLAQALPLLEEKLQ